MSDLRMNYHEELDEVRNTIVTLAAHVTEAIPRATEALIDNNLELAQEVISHDDLRADEEQGEETKDNRRHTRQDLEDRLEESPGLCACVLREVDG